MIDSKGMISNNLYKFIFTFLFATFCGQVTIAQKNELISKQISFRGLTVENGLSQNSVVSIAQDSVGFMWFATQDGLNKYDGKTFTHYDRQFEDVTRPTFSKLGKVYVDRDGTLWIISSSGKLEKFDASQNTFHTVTGIEQASTIFQSSNKKIFVGTYGNGIFKIDPISKDTIQIVPHEKGSLNYYDFTENSEEIFVATSMGILKISKNRFNISESDSLQSIAFSSLSTDKKNTVYAGSFGKGLFIKKNLENDFSRFSGFGSIILPTNLNIQDILIDKQNRLWIATYGKGVYLVDFEKQTIQHFNSNKNDPYALHYNDVLCLYEDFTETIWLGTDGAGLSYYDRHLVKFNVLTSRQTPSNIFVDVVRSIAVEENIIWLGTSGKGLTKINQALKSFKTFTEENSNLSGNRIMSLLYDGTKLWIGHQNEGLQILDSQNKFKTFPETEGLTIWKIYKDSKGLIWLCTRSQGLLLFDEKLGILKKYTAENSSLTTNNIRTVTQGNKETLWIGTENNGVFRLNLTTNNLSKIKIIPDNIKCLFYANNLLWIGTNGNGLKLYNISEKNVHTFTKENGLPNNVIYGILPDGENNLWLSSNKGLTKITVDANYRAIIENYNNYDGLQAFEYNTGAYFKDKKGTLYFGGLEGINWFQPDQLTFNPKKPKTVITNLKVFNTETEIVPNEKFPHNKNTLTFSFSSLHYSQPERNQYKYRLVNNDDNWISSGNNNVAHYTNLPPNDYTFQVISSNYDGVWNTNPATYSFTILKPWYATNLARSLYFIGGVLLVFLIYKYLKWRWNVKNQLRLEHEETERLKKIDQLKTKLYANISHEIRTPLTLISGPLENQLKNKRLAKQDKKDLNLIKQNSNRLLRLVNQMLDLSLVDSGEIKLTIENGNLSALLKQIINTFQYKASKKNIVIESSINGLKNCWFDKDIIEKVISNLISNSLKYTPKKSIINIEANEKNGWFIFMITNDKGDLNTPELNQLFKRFYQNDNSQEGVGVGLALVNELTILSKGNVKASIVNKNEIQFTLKLPITNKAFNVNEISSKEYQRIEKNAIVNNKTNINEKPLLLVVEDNKDIRSYITSIFTDKYDIIEAKNGKIGIEKAKKKLPDLIISDIMMPVENGIVLCDTIKSNEITSHIPIILLTAKVGEQNEIEGFKTGADAYFTKPFSPEKLRIRVEKLIESRHKLKEQFGKTFDLNTDLAINSTETDFLKSIQKILDKHITDPDLTSEKFSKLSAHEPYPTAPKTNIYCRHEHNYIYSFSTIKTGLWFIEKIR